MIISCPACATRFQVPDALLRQGPRKVRCSSCAHVWQVEGQTAVSAAQAPPAMESSGEPERIDVETEAARLLAVSRRANAAQHTRQRRRAGMRRKWAALAATAALVASAAIAFREGVVRHFPAAASLYALVNMPVNVRGVDFRNVRYDRDFENGLPVLTVRGEVVNLRPRPVVLPQLRFGLRDVSGQEIYHWTMDVSRDPLEPRNAAKFVARLASPPSEARDILIRFADAGEAGRR